MATSSSSSSGLSSGGEHLSWWVLLPSLSPSLPPYNMSRITRLGVTSRRIEGHEKGLRFPRRSPEKIKVFSFFFSFVLHLLPQSIFFLAPILKNSVPEHRPGFSRVFRCCWGISLSLSLFLSSPWPVFEGKAAFVDKIDSFINNGFRYRSHLLLSDPRQNSCFVRWSDPKPAKLDNFEYMNVTLKLTRLLLLFRVCFNLSFIFEIAVRNKDPVLV